MDLTLFRKIAGNVKADPTNEKYRKLKLTNAKFRAKVWDHPQMQTLMQAAGWEVQSFEEGEAVVLPQNADPAVLWELVNEMQPTQAQAPASASGPAQTPAQTPSVGSVPAPLSKDALAVLAERERGLAKVNREKAEKRRIKEQMLADRANSAQREIRASHAQLPQGGGAGAAGYGGARVTRFGDVGVDLNKGGS